MEGNRKERKGKKKWGEKDGKKGRKEGRNQGNKHDRRREERQTKLRVSKVLRPKTEKISQKKRSDQPKV